MTHQPAAHLLTFEAWVDAKWHALSEDYQHRYTSAFGDDQARFACASNGGDECAALERYHHLVLNGPREATVPLDVYDSWPENVGYDAERYFFDLGDRLDDRLRASVHRAASRVDGGSSRAAAPGF